MLAIAGAHDDVMDNPSSDKAWRKLHNTLKDKAEMQRQDGEDLQPISPVLSASFDALGQEQRNHFLRLAVLPHGLMVLDDLLCNLWEKAVSSRFSDFRCVFSGILIELSQVYGKHSVVSQGI